MPFCGEHDQPLSLVCGEDARLAWGGRLLAIGACVLILSGGLAAELKLALAVTMIAHLRAPAGRDGPGLVIQPHGGCRWHGATGRVQPAAWVSRWYAVLQLFEDGRRCAVIVSASRQAPGEYRKLLAWLRLGRWQSGSGSDR